MRNLTVTSLSRDKIAQAFPLVRHSEPELSLEQWQRFALGLLEGQNCRPQGVMAVLSEQNYILGLFTYRVEADLRHGCILEAANFFAMDLLDPQAVASALAESLEDLALRHGCQAIHTTIAPNMACQEHWLARMFKNFGHEVDCVRFCKAISTT